MAPKANHQREGVLMNSEEVEQAIHHFKTNAPLIAAKVQAELDQLKKNPTPVVVSVLTPDEGHKPLALEFLLDAPFHRNTHLFQELPVGGALSKTQQGNTHVTIPISVEHTPAEVAEIFKTTNTVLSKMKL
jgi:hypothetical protein